MLAPAFDYKISERSGSGLSLFGPGEHRRGVRNLSFEFGGSDVAFHGHSYSLFHSVKVIEDQEIL